MEAHPEPVTVSVRRLFLSAMFPQSLKNLELYQTIPECPALWAGSFTLKINGDYPMFQTGFSDSFPSYPWQKPIKPGSFFKEDGLKGGG